MVTLTDDDSTLPLLARGGIHQTSVVVASTPALLGNPVAASPTPSANSESVSTTPSPPPGTGTPAATTAAARTNRRKQLSPQRSVSRNDVRGRYFFLADATFKPASSAATADAAAASHEPVARTDGTASEADASTDRRSRKVRPGASPATSTSASSLRRTAKGKEPVSGTMSS